MWKPESEKDAILPSNMTQLSPDEYQQMIEHMEQCSTCRAAHPDFSTFLEQLPVAEYDRVKGEILAHIKRGGLQERFIARARAAGIQFSDELLKRYQPRPRLTLSYPWV